jgi:exosortase
VSTAPSTPVAATPELVSDQERAGDPVVWGLTATAWVKVLIVSGLLVALFRFNLARLWSKTNPISGEANWGHAPLVPIIGLYYLYLNRDQLLAATVKPIIFERPTRTRLIVSAAAILVGLVIYLLALTSGSSLAVFVRYAGEGAVGWGVLMLALGWGLGNVLFGMLVFAGGIYPIRNDWVCDYGMVHTIFGVVLTLCGWEVMRVAGFPIAFLLCALPWPGLFYSKVAGPLQTLAAKVAVRMLNFTGIDSFREGTKMFISGANGGYRPLNVAEACAGLRSLMTFISVAAAVAFLSNRAMWQKVVITLSAIPIAIFCNVLRVTGQAYIDRIAGPQWSENFAHQFVGVVMLIPAFFLILGVSWALDQIFVEEVEAKPKRFGKPAAVAAAATATATAPPRAAEKKVIVVQPKSVAGGAQIAKTQAAAGPAAVPKPVAQPVVKPTTAAPAKPAASAQPAAPVRPSMPAPPPPARMPPRTNLTGRPASPRNDRPTEGA